MALTVEQLARRSSGIGASDAAAAIGLNPYYSPVELWMEKRGLAPAFAGNEATKWGKLLEPAVRQEYAEVTSRVVRLPPDTLVHPTVTYLVCHPDGITDDGRLYEGKTARYPDGWGEPRTDQIPEQYLIQVQHSLMVTALAIADVAVLIGGQDFRLYHVEADEELQAAILEAESEFWLYVERGTRPPLDYRASNAIGVLKKLYPGTNGEVVQATEECEEWRQLFEGYKASAKTIEQDGEEMKARLLDYMGEAAVLRFSDGRCLRRALVKRKGYEVKPAEYIESRWISG